MSAADAAMLVVAGVLAGITGTVGLASLVSYPALLAVGLHPLDANVTNTVALVSIAVGAVAGSRPELSGQTRRVLRYGALTLLGGSAGAVLLLATPPGAFTLAVPWLIAGAALLLALQPRLVRRPAGVIDERGLPVSAAVLGVGVYLGYFGAGGGVALLAVLALALPEPLARVNAVKTVSGGFANLLAAFAFALVAPVHWAAVGALATGLLVGGAVGPAIVRVLPAKAVRLAVSAAALCLAVSLGVNAYAAG
ncbi:sulfite exporter TauE/SafE family protein [Pseudofrankia sp. BMG5.37]|uniref:sulfite exporter TauE/SafE family protein n=1 Tax=Pseudofrankia sp. BMG5.37 TaxID=3050035 RepID=UPI0028939743|nr:sulfite exporter TauE/SafE family protein [Pseudofrankia sp. BMG5.37]MDT3440449.1 sulfite exporter TauE/SafE family protein [Pseudofrankia sp. BMG5.37]